MKGSKATRQTSKNRFELNDSIKAPLRLNFCGSTGRLATIPVGVTLKLDERLEESDAGAGGIGASGKTGCSTLSGLAVSELDEVSARLAEIAGASVPDR